MYDLDGDGVLDEAEQAMRDRDKSGRGYLTNEEIYQIVREQMLAQKDVNLYKKVTAGLLCFVFILALSNLGTSFASAILAKDTKADSSTGTLQFKSNSDVLGFNQASEVFELEELEVEERRARRAMVLAEMEEDPNHENHVHRRLGKKVQNACTCSKIAFDNGKVSERDLITLTAKCDGVKTVSIKRKWKGGAIDLDTLCRPGTTIVKKGRRKTNKSQTKVKIVNEQIVFKQPGNKDGNKGDVAFDCQNGWW